MSLGKIFIVSGPAGVGKSTVCERLLSENNINLKRIVTATTRQPRKGEIDGKDYCFINEKTFLRYIAEDMFLEYANVHKKYYYGTPISQVISNMKHGIHSLLIIDVQGVSSIRKKYHFLGKNLVTIFIRPENEQVLMDRLKQRNTDDENEIARRIASVQHELKSTRGYDYEIISGTKVEDFYSLKSIFDFETREQDQLVSFTYHPKLSLIKSAL